MVIVWQYDAVPQSSVHFLPIVGSRLDGKQYFYLYRPDLSNDALSEMALSFVGPRTGTDQIIAQMGLPCAAAQVGEKSEIALLYSHFTVRVEFAIMPNGDYPFPILHGGVWGFDMQPNACAAAAQTSPWRGFRTFRPN
jgi:hypothetical protein